MSEIFTIYKITNNINNKIYIGAHKTSDLEDDYMGSGTNLKKSQAKYGIENFNKEIIFRAVSSDIMYWVERMIVDEEFVKSDETYNMKIGGIGGFDHTRNMVTVKIDTNTYKNISKAEYREGNYETSSHNKSVVRDELGNIIKIPVSEAIERGLKGVRYGSTHSDEVKNKLRICRKLSKGLYCWINNSTQEIKSLKTNINEYVNNGWSLGRFSSKWIINPVTAEVKKVKHSELTNYLDLGWCVGRKL